MTNINAAIKVKSHKKSSRNDLIFYLIFMIWPITQFAIFYIGVNFQSILMAFQSYDLLSHTTTWTVDNFVTGFQMMTGSAEMLQRLKMSLICYGFSLLVGVPLGLFFSYFIYKKFFGSGLFKVILFLPGIISAIVMVCIYQTYVELAVPEIVYNWFGKEILGLIENPDTRFAAIMFYDIFVSFGTSVLMYSNSMCEINPEIVESAHLDGAKGFREFFSITVPMVFPTLKTFLIVGVAGIFTNQLGLFSFYGPGAPSELQTYGYYIYSVIQSAGSKAEYPLPAAIGLMMTVVAVPLTYIVKLLLDKFGPSAE